MSTKSFIKYNSDDTPVLLPNMSQLIQVLSNDDISVEELVCEIEKSPSIVIRIISIANSVWSSPAAPIHTLIDAITRLGMQVVRSAAIALTVASPFNTSRCKEFDASHYWSTSFLTAEAAMKIESLQDSVKNIALYRTAGLLHNIGILWLAQDWPEETDTAFQLYARGEVHNLSHAFQQTCHTDYSDLGGHLARSLKLPIELSDAIDFHCDLNYQGENDQISNIVGISAVLAHSVLEEKECEIAQMIKEYSLSPNQLQLEEALLFLQKKRDSIVALAETINSTM